MPVASLTRERIRFLSDMMFDMYAVRTPEHHPVTEYRTSSYRVRSTEDDKTDIPPV